MPNAVTVDILGNSKDLEAALKGSQEKLEAFAGKAKRVAQSMQLFSAAIVGAGVGLVKLASDLEESNSKFETVFGDLTRAADRWAEDQARLIGRGVQDTKNNLADYAVVLQGIGYPDQEALEFSKTLTGLTADLGSFHNVSEDRVNLALKGALTGEFESMKQFGIVVRAADVDMRAMNDTGKKSKDALTEMEKATARLNLVMERAGVAVGDAERTADGFANQLKALQGEAWDAAAAFGEQLLPTATELVKIARGAVEWFSSLSARTKDLVIYAAGLTVGVNALAFALWGGAAAAGALWAALTGPAGGALLTVTVALSAIGYAWYSLADDIETAGARTKPTIDEMIGRIGDLNVVVDEQGQLVKDARTDWEEYESVLKGVNDVLRTQFEDQINLHNLLNPENMISPEDLYKQWELVGVGMRDALGRGFKGEDREGGEAIPIPMPFEPQLAGVTGLTDDDFAALINDAIPGLQKHIDELQLGDLDNLTSDGIKIPIPVEMQPDLTLAEPAEGWSFPTDTELINAATAMTSDGIPIPVPIEIDPQFDLHKIEGEDGLLPQLRTLGEQGAQAFRDVGNAAVNLGVVLPGTLGDLAAEIGSWATERAEEIQQYVDAINSIVDAWTSVTNLTNTILKFFQDTGSAATSTATSVVSVANAANATTTALAGTETAAAGASAALAGGSAGGGAAVGAGAGGGVAKASSVAGASLATVAAGTAAFVTAALGAIEVIQRGAIATAFSGNRGEGTSTSGQSPGAAPGHSPFHAPDMSGATPLTFDEWVARGADPEKMAAQGYGPESPPFIWAARTGFRGLLTRDTPFLAHAGEMVDIRPASRHPGNMGTGGQELHLTVNIYGTVGDENIGQMIADEVRRAGIGNDY